jgi:hypothetical protein
VDKHFARGKSNLVEYPGSPTPMILPQSTRLTVRNLGDVTDLAWSILGYLWF